LAGKDWKYADGLKSTFFNWNGKVPKAPFPNAVIMPNGLWVDDNAINARVFIVETSCSSSLLFAQAEERLLLAAHAEPNRSVIEWVNNTGSKNDYFTVEKLNAKTGEFETLERVNNKYDNDNAVHYLTYDNAPAEGENTYRIQLTYKDGATRLSGDQTLIFTGKSGVRVFPNPANDALSVDLSNYLNQAVTIHLYDYQGQERLVKKVDNASNAPVELNTADMPVGSYMIRVASKGKRDVTKSVVIAH
jgi:hypothetical protein